MTADDAPGTRARQCSHSTRSRRYLASGSSASWSAPENSARFVCLRAFPARSRRRRAARCSINCSTCGAGSSSATCSISARVLIARKIGRSECQGKPRLRPARHLRRGIRRAKGGLGGVAGHRFGSTRRESQHARQHVFYDKIGSVSLRWLSSNSVPWGHKAPHRVATGSHSLIGAGIPPPSVYVCRRNGYGSSDAPQDKRLEGSARSPL